MPPAGVMKDFLGRYEQLSLRFYFESSNYIFLQSLQKKDHKKEARTVVDYTCTILAVGASISLRISRQPLDESVEHKQYTVSQCIHYPKGDSYDHRPNGSVRHVTRCTPKKHIHREPTHRPSAGKFSIENPGTKHVRHNLKNCRGETSFKQLAAIIKLI